MTAEKAKAAARRATAAYRARHPERVKARRRNNYKTKETSATARRRSNPATWGALAIHNIRYRARQRSLPFDLQPSDIVVPPVCPVLGIPLLLGPKAPRNNRPSVDRFDNLKGYTKDNICVISFRANQLKRDATVGEVRGLLTYMERVVL